MKRYKIQIEVPKAKVKEVETISCNGPEEANHIAQNAAWALYTKVEGSSYDLPSYEDLFDRYRSEWFDRAERDFDQSLDDLYVRTIINNIDYSVEEVIQ